MIIDKIKTNRLLSKLKSEERKNADMLHLIANENTMSPLATRFYESPLGLRYDFGKGINGVIENQIFSSYASPELTEIQHIINEAKQKLNTMLKAQFCTLSVLSGLHSMMCALLALTKLGDTVMTVNDEDGGHFCTHKLLEMVGRKYVYAVYNESEHKLDVRKTAEIIKKNMVKVVYLDVSISLCPLPIRELRKHIPKDVIIVYDASHTLGLVMAGEFQSPLAEGADVISANTHKTFPGPHKGLMAFKDIDLGLKVNAAISDSLYSTVHTNSELALAVSIIEFSIYGKLYAQQIVKNSNALGMALAKRGLNVRKIDGSYSYNHQVHLFVDMKGAKIVSLFLKNRMSISTSNALGGKMFIRLGTQEITKMGMKEKDMDKIADFIKSTLTNRNVSKQVILFNSLFKKVKYCLPYNLKE